MKTWWKVTQEQNTQRLPLRKTAGGWQGSAYNNKGKLVSVYVPEKSDEE